MVPALSFIFIYYMPPMPVAAPHHRKHTSRQMANSHTPQLHNWVPVSHRKIGGVTALGSQLTARRQNAVYRLDTKPKSLIRCNLISSWIGHKLFLGWWREWWRQRQPMASVQACAMRSAHNQVEMCIYHIHTFDYAWEWDVNIGRNWPKCDDPHSYINETGHIK